jgi:hypothetical protein
MRIDASGRVVRAAWVGPRVEHVFGTHDLWLFVVSGLLLNVTPGPDTLYIVGRSSTQGGRAGSVAACGVGEPVCRGVRARLDA